MPLLNDFAEILMRNPKMPAADGIKRVKIEFMVNYFE